MVRSETGYILKAFIKTNILDKNDVKTKMASSYL